MKIAEQIAPAPAGGGATETGATRDPAAEPSRFAEDYARAEAREEGAGERASGAGDPGLAPVAAGVDARPTDRAPSADNAAAAAATDGAAAAPQDVTRLAARDRLAGEIEAVAEDRRADSPPVASAETAPRAEARAPSLTGAAEFRVDDDPAASATPPSERAPAAPVSDALAAPRGGDAAAGTPGLEPSADERSAAADRTPGAPSAETPTALADPNAKPAPDAATPVVGGASSPTAPADAAAPGARGDALRSVGAAPSAASTATSTATSAAASSTTSPSAAAPAEPDQPAAAPGSVDATAATGAPGVDGEAAARDVAETETRRGVESNRGNGAAWSVEAARADAAKATAGAGTSAPGAVETIAGADRMADPALGGLVAGAERGAGPAPTPAPAPTAGPAPQALAAPVAAQVALAAAAQKKDGSIELRLDPPELGKVRLELRFDGADQVSVTVQAERQETLDLMRRNAADLERQLREAGLSLDTLDFAGADQGGGADAWAEAWGGGGSEGWGDGGDADARRFAERVALDADAPATPPRFAQFGPDGRVALGPAGPGLDLRV